MNNKVFVISTAHNDLGNVKRLLGCISRQSYRNISIVIVDHGSDNGVSRYLKLYFPEVIIIRGSESFWWTGAVHSAVSYVLKNAEAGDYVLTLNDDCVFEKDYVNNLLKVARKNPNSIVGSLIIEKSSGRIWDSGISIDWRKGQFYNNVSQSEEDIKKGIKTRGGFDALPTKGTLYPVSVFKKAGNFDAKNLPHYLSDYEYSIRAKRKGFNLVVSYDAKIYNDVKRTGFGEKLPDKISLGYFFRLLFSRKSRVNVVDHWRFISLSCPSEFKFINYLRILAKSIYYLLHVPPLTVFLPLAKKLRS